MRRLGKRIVAITLAATMMGSLTPQAMTFLQNEVVYAAETSGAVYESTDSKEVKDVDFSDLEDVNWDRKENVEYANTNDEVRKINENYKIKVKIDRLVRNEFSELTTYLSNFKCNKKVLSFIVEDDDIQMIEDFIFEQVYIPKNDFTISNMDQSTSIFINGLKLSYIKKIPQ